jgi:transposase
VEESALAAGLKTSAPGAAETRLHRRKRAERNGLIGYAIAGITVWRFYFRLYEGTIRKEEGVAFLRHLRRHVRGKLLIIWDHLKQHRSRLVKDYVASERGAIELEYLPAYAPELNPVEYIWGYWKHELPNLCARDLVELGTAARAALRRMRRRPALVASFWKQAELSL